MSSGISTDSLFLESLWIFFSWYHARYSFKHALYLVLDREGGIMDGLECQKAQVPAQLDKSESNRGDSPSVSAGGLVWLPSLLEPGNSGNLLGAGLLSTNLG